MTLLTMMLLPFLMSEHTSFLSSNAIVAMFICAIKVCVIAFLAAAGSSALGGFFDSIKGNFASKGKSLLGIFIQLNMTVGFFLFMVLKIPSLISGLLSGQPSMGAGDALNTVRSAAGQASRFAGSVRSGGASALRSGLKAAGAVSGAYAAASAIADSGGDDSGGGGGNTRMSSISDIGGETDATGMGATSGLSGSGGSGVSRMAASTGGGGGAASGLSGDNGSTDMPVSDGGSASASSSQSNGKKGKLGRFGKALGRAVKNAAVSSVYNSSYANAYRDGYNIGRDPYQANRDGGEKRSWQSGDVLDAQGKATSYGRNENSTPPVIVVSNPTPKVPNIGTFDPNGFYG